MSRKFINPLQITKEDLPLIVFSDNRRTFISFGIKMHTKGNYNHVMVMHRESYFASQGFNGHKEVPVKKYMKPSIMLKFWQCENLSETAKKEFLKMVEKDLKAPWWRNMYDFLGIFGQLIRIRKINIPWARYCSERVVPYIRKIFSIATPEHPAPSDINEIFKRHLKMKILGYWFDD